MQHSYVMLDNSHDCVVFVDSRGFYDTTEYRAFCSSWNSSACTGTVSEGGHAGICDYSSTTEPSAGQQHNGWVDSEAQSATAASMRERATVPYGGGGGGGQI